MNLVDLFVIGFALITVYFAFRVQRQAMAVQRAADALLRLGVDVSAAVVTGDQIAVISSDQIHRNAEGELSTFCDLRLNVHLCDRPPRHAGVKHACRCGVTWECRRGGAGRGRRAVRRLRSFVLRRRVREELRSCICAPRERITEPDGRCYRCSGHVSESMDELTQAQGPPIEVSR